ncbi:MULTISPECIES: class IV adenylate cyclase [Streptomyces]|uniref:Class IV adenylate cyclase n=1 Tax=Streptomyces chengmaiensis TaxID=3040919 RepID=A0ABT6HJW2_9ACTN|nr:MULTISPECIES: class IV adenylate cyclase [Streptomyces]MDH2389039.1 class IV adenylate cyclase [Streptomyces chengmaiensis]WRQ82682.1 class IV adenylate cyclase [Streptomyces sp. MUM 178J]
MIEAELKARVHTPERVLRQLEEWAAGRAEVYSDTYYDFPDGALSARDQELRVRTVHGADSTCTVLTFKDAKVDQASGSKPEEETPVGDAAAIHAIVRGLGYVPVISFEKRCRNYDFQARGRAMLATLVRVPEVDGTFLELETLADEKELAAALADVRSVLADLGIGEADLTTELYTDAVRARRAT